MSVVWRGVEEVFHRVRFFATSLLSRLFTSVMWSVVVVDSWLWCHWWYFWFAILATPLVGSLVSAVQDWVCWVFYGIKFLKHDFNLTVHIWGFRLYRIVR